MPKRFEIATEITAVARGAARVFRNVRRNFAGMSRDAKKLNRAWEGLSRSGGQLGRNIGGVGLGLSAATVGAFALAKSSAAVSSEIVNAADKLGFGVERYQELVFAADQASVSQGKMEIALQRLVRKQGQAANGNKEMTDLFDALGVSVRDTAGNLKAPNALLGDLAEAFSKIEDPALRVLAAQKLFDSEGVDFVRVLEGGVAGLEKMATEAHRTGQVLSEAGQRDAKIFDEKMASLTGTVKAFARDLTGQMAPALTETGTALQDYLVENRADLVARFGAAVKVAGDIARGFQGAIETIAPTVRRIVEAMGGWERVGLIVAALLGAKLLLPVVGLGFHLASLIGTAAKLSKTLALLTLANPVFAAIAALAAGAALIIANWDSIAGFFSDLWGRVTDSFDRGVIDGLVSLVAELNLVTLFASAVDGLAGKFLGLDLGLADAVKSSIEAALGFVRDGFGEIRGAIEGAIGGAMAFVRRGFAGLRLVVSNAAIFLLEKVQGVLGALPSFALDAAGIDTAGLAGTLEALRRARGEDQALLAGARGGGGPGGGSTSPLAAAAQRVRTEVVIVGENLPPGLRLEPRDSSADDLTIEVGASLAGTGRL